MSNAVMANFNMKGKNGKTGFSSTKISKAVVGELATLLHKFVQSYRILIS